MGRKAFLEKQDAIDIIKKYISHFATTNLPKWNAKVYHDMSAELKGKWSAHSIYINVREDRRNILTEARKELNIEVEPQLTHDDLEYDSTDDNDDTPLDDSCASEKEGFELFDLILTRREWDEIKPSGTVVYGDRERFVLKPKVWANVIDLAFRHQYRMPCAFTYRRAEVTRPSDGPRYIIKISAKCRAPTCRNEFLANGTVEIDSSDDLILSVRARDTRHSPHADVKRPFNGNRRKIEAKAIIAEGPSVWRKRNARELMKPGDTEPPQLPRGDVLRRAKKEAVDENLGIKPTDGHDVIGALNKIKLDPLYRGLISRVGHEPFYAMYCTPAQNHAYKEYCRIKRGASTIAIDSTGSLVRKIKHTIKESAHIFLFSIVINFERTTMAVNQMISESNETEFIAYWLKTWLRSVKEPNEAVCDYSRALLSGLSLAFNNQTIKSYVNDLFIAATEPNKKRVRPVTYIRVDVAHLIHLVCRWKCFKKVTHTAIKHFYVRCVALMLNCQTVDEFERIFTLTCIVGLQAYDDTQLNILSVSSPQQARQQLEDIIAVGGVSENVETLEADNRHTENRSNHDDVFETYSTDGKTKRVIFEWEKPLEDGTVIEQWLRQRLSMCKQRVQKGGNLNAFYFPDFIQNLSILSKEFPLWTSAALPYNSQHASSSIVEGYFNDLKTRALTQPKPPMRADCFIRAHLRDILGAEPLFRAKLVHHATKSIDQCSPQDGCDLPVEAIEEVEHLKNNINKSPVPLSRVINESEVLSFPPDDTSFVEIGWTDPAFQTNVLEDSDLKSRENWKDKAQNHYYTDSDFSSEELQTPFSGYLDHSYCTAQNVQSEADKRNSPMLIANKSNFQTKTKVENNLPPLESVKFNLPTFNEKNVGNNLPPLESIDFSFPTFNEENVENSLPPLDSVEFNLPTLNEENVANNLAPLESIDFSFPTFNEENVENSLPPLDSVEFNLPTLNEENVANNLPPLESVEFDFPTFDEKMFESDILPPESIELNLPNSNEKNVGTNLPPLRAVESNIPILKRPKDQSNDLPLIPVEKNHPTLKKKNVHEVILNKSSVNQKPTINSTAYFGAYPEVRQLNQRIYKSMKPYLLPNGLRITRACRCDDNKNYFIRNTCSFDSLVHILMTSAIDDQQYALILDESKNKTLAFVSKLIKRGPTEEIYRDRINILKPWFPLISNLQTRNRTLSSTINALSSVENMVTKVMDSAPSIVRQMHCTHCTRPLISVPFVTPNHNVIAKHGFEHLENALDLQPAYENIKCACPGYYTLFNNWNYHLLVGLDIRGTTDSGVSPSGQMCYLRQIPKSLGFEQVDATKIEYGLTGVIGYSRQKEHFIAYCLRANGMWQEYDDMKTKANSYKDNNLIEPHLAVYIQKRSDPHKTVDSIPK